MDLINIFSADMAASINPFGAELWQLRDSAGHDLLWSGDAPFWCARAPLLFPIVGRLVNDSYFFNGQSFSLPQHGFAPRSNFEVVASSNSSATLRLFWNVATFDQYPFRFILDVSYTLDERSLIMEAVVKNIDDKDVPASFGFHPALRWPLRTGENRSDGYIEFEKEEPPAIRRLHNGLRGAQEFPTPVDRRRLWLA